MQRYSNLLLLCLIQVNRGSEDHVIRLVPAAGEIFRTSTNPGADLLCDLCFLVKTVPSLSTALSLPPAASGHTQDLRHIFRSRLYKYAGLLRQRVNFSELSRPRPFLDDVCVTKEKRY